MAEVAHKLAIFRGILKFKSNVQKIWGVLIFLSIVTIRWLWGLLNRIFDELFSEYEAVELDIYYFDIG